MPNLEFSEWPGAWERHVIRKTDFPLLFSDRKPPVTKDLEQAQLLDKQELAQLELELAELLEQCSTITETTNIEHVCKIKSDLDRCYDTACGLGADLSEQKEALTLLNEVITTAIRRALRDDDEHGRLLLIKQESVRMRHLTRLNYPIVCDLLRSVCPIPPAEIPAALLCETDEAFTVALEVLDDNKRKYLAEGIDTISHRLKDKANLLGLERKQKLLQKTLVASSVSGSVQSETLSSVEPEPG